MRTECRHLISFPFCLRTSLTDCRKRLCQLGNMRSNMNRKMSFETTSQKKKILKIADVGGQNILLLRDRSIPIIVLTSQMTNKLLRLRKLSSSGNLAFVHLKMLWFAVSSRILNPLDKQWISAHLRVFLSTNLPCT